MSSTILPGSFNKRFSAVVALLLTLGFALLAIRGLDLTDGSLLASLEMRLLDAKFRLRGARPGGSEVIIVALDDKTLAKLGSGRVFQRSYFAALISKLAQAGPKAIGFDVTFPDRDVSDPRNDHLFANAIHDANSVVLGVTVELETPGPRRAEEKLDDTLNVIVEKQIFPVLIYEPGGVRQTQSVFRGQKLQANLPELTNAAASFGFVNFHADREGRLRYQPQMIDYGGRLYPSLDLQLLRRYLDAPSVLVIHNFKGYITGVRAGNHTLPTDHTGRLMVDYNGPRGTYSTVPMIDVIEGHIAPEAFKDKIVLIGASAVGLNDVVATPFDPLLPGVELHANVIDNALHDRYLYRDWAAEAVDLSLILIFGIVLGYSLPKFNATRSVFYSSFAFAIFILFNYWAFIRLHWVLSLVYPGFSFVLTSASLISYKYLTEEREKKRTKQTFQYYLDPLVIEEVMNNPDTLKLGGEKRDLTVLFSDIRGFTIFSERMAPAEVVQFLNQYFEKMQAIIFQYRGTLDKLIGDALMCFWGAPLESRDHALRGVLTALQMIHAVEDLRGILVLPGGAKFEIGIGVNTGPMVFGNMGSPTRFSYTVIGDNVNLASRLESLNKYYDTNILISETTFEAVRDLILCREIDRVQVKGKSQAVTIYEPLGMKQIEYERRHKADRRSSVTMMKRVAKTLAIIRHGDRRREERRLGSEQLFARPEQEEIATMYEHGLAMYRKGDFDSAAMAFDHVLSLSATDGPSRVMKNRIAKLQSEQGEAEFDPVYKFHDK